jgi:transposase
VPPWITHFSGNCSLKFDAITLRALPHDFPAWESVYGYFNSLCEVALWEDINRILRQGVRQAAGREAEPSVVIVDSQSVKTAEKKAIVAALMAASE